MIDVTRVPVESLNPMAFEPFGEVVSSKPCDSTTLNRAPGEMCFLWVLTMLEFHKQPFIGSSRYYYRGSRCEYLQQHPASNMVLLPTDSRPSVIWVAPDDGGRPLLDGVRAILLDGRAGVAVKPGMWMRYAYPVLGHADYAYVSSRVNPEEDINRVDLESDYGLVLEWYFGPPADPGAEYTEGGAVRALSAEGRRGAER